MELVIPIKEGTKSKAMLTLLNPFLSHLTDVEMDLVDIMLKKDIKILDKNTRADVRQALNMSKYSFNNHVLRLKSKKILIQTTQDLFLNPQIKYFTDANEVTIRFNEQPTGSVKTNS